MRINRSIFQRVLLGSALWIVADSRLVAPVVGPQKHVLLLYDSRSDMLGNIVVDRTIRSVLNREFTVNLDVRSEYFEPTVQPSQDYAALADWLSNKYAGATFDVVVAVGAGALRFASLHKGDLFESAQIIFWGRRDNLANWESGAPITGVVAPEMERSVKATVDFICSLQPDVRQIIVVSGASLVDKRWESAARAALRSYEGRFAASYLAALTLEDLQGRLAQLPRGTAILFLTVNEDGAGRNLLKSDVLRRLVQTASAPVYSTSVLFTDTGIVGGALVDQEDLARETGILVARLLRGEQAKDIPVQEGSLTPTMNWKQLIRWRISESKIPPGTIIINRDPSIWELYRWPIVGVLSLCALEAMLIVALLIHRTRRERAERSLAESRRLLQSIIDGLKTQVALLDGTGRIVAANRAWLRFRDANGGTGECVGRNYFDVCGSNIGRAEARTVAEAFEGLLSGARDDFSCVYGWGGPSGGKSWFQLRMGRFHTDGAPWVVMQYEDVTEIQEAHDSQRRLTGMILRAQDDERRRIARDLHDETVQNVAGIKAVLRRVQKNSPNLESSTLERVGEGLALCDQVIQELRTLSYVLHSPLLDQLGLLPALQWFIRGFTERSGIKVELVVNGDVERLPTDFETALFRVAQESLSNIDRHSGSPSALICLTHNDSSFVLQISDRGRGISRRTGSRNLAEAAPGVGIMGMGERIRQLGGRFEIESGDHGTTVTARVFFEKGAYAAHPNC